MSWIFHEPFDPAVHARRRLVAPPGPAPRPYNPAGRVLASLLAAGTFEAFAVDARRPLFALGHPTPGPDGGRSAAFVIQFAGRGDDPFGNDGLAAAADQGLAGQGLTVLATEDLASFGGVSASREV